MPKMFIGLLLCLAVFAGPAAAAAALPPGAVSYRTVLKTDDYFVALKTDSVAWTVPADGDIAVSLTAKWSYVRPERAGRNYPAGRPSFNWRISKYALQYDQNTGFVKVLEMETTLYDNQGREAVVLKNANAGWRLLLPGDPDFEAFDKILQYLADEGR